MQRKPPKNYWEDIEPSCWLCCRFDIRTSLRLDGSSPHPPFAPVPEDFWFDYAEHRMCWVNETDDACALLLVLCKPLDRTAEKERQAWADADEAALAFLGQLALVCGTWTYGTLAEIVNSGCLGRGLLLSPRDKSFGSCFQMDCFPNIVIANLHKFTSQDQRYACELFRVAMNVPKSESRARFAALYQVVELLCNREFIRLRRGAKATAAQKFDEWLESRLHDAIASDHLRLFSPAELLTRKPHQSKLTGYDGYLIAIRDAYSHGGVADERTEKFEEGKSAEETRTMRCCALNVVEALALHLLQELKESDSQFWLHSFDANPAGERPPSYSSSSRPRTNAS